MVGGQPCHSLLVLIFWACSLMTGILSTSPSLSCPRHEIGTYFRAEVQQAMLSLMLLLLVAT